MSKSISTKFILLFMVLAIFSSFSFAQQPAAEPEQALQNTETVNENESLPFMKTVQPHDSAEPSTGKLVLKTFGAMILIVGLIFFGAWGFEKTRDWRHQGNLADDAPQLAVLSTVSLGTNRSLSVVKFGERVLLIGSTVQTFTLLADETKEKPVAVTRSRSVAELLAEDDSSFAAEFDYAQSQLNLLDNEGELI